MTDSTYVVYIEWSPGHTSPPIGLFTSQAELERAKTEVRKHLKAAGKPWLGRVKASPIVSLDRVEGWLATEEEEEHHD